MKSTFVCIVLCSNLLAQPPASKGGASKSGTSKGAPSAARASLQNPAALKAKAPEVYKVQFTTSKGDFVVEVHRDWAPNGADRFYNLAKNGFFDDAPFFRAIKGFMVQFGLSAKPAVNKAWDNATIMDDPVKQSNKRGYLTFAATSMKNSRSTQLFINLADNAGLDPQGFAPIGNVAEGMDVVDKLYTGYGETIQSAGRIGGEGRPYVDKTFPQMDRINTTKILAAPAADKK